MADADMDPRVDAKKAVNLSGESVRVLVGTDEECTIVHAELLCSSSKFFKTALKEEWTEGQQRVVKLPEDDPKAFMAYAQWLYSGKIYTVVKSEAPKDYVPDFLPLVELFVLAEKILDPKFQDCVTNSIVATSRQAYKDGKCYFPAPRCVNRMYTATAKGSAGRRLMLDFCARYAHSEWTFPDSNQDFMSDFVRALVEDRGQPISKTEKYGQLDSGFPCKYHVHDKDEPCGQKP